MIIDLVRLSLSPIPLAVALFFAVLVYRREDWEFKKAAIVFVITILIFLLVEEVPSFDKHSLMRLIIYLAAGGALILIAVWVDHWQWKKSLLKYRKLFNIPETPQKKDKRTAVQLFVKAVAETFLVKPKQEKKTTKADLPERRKRRLRIAGTIFRNLLAAAVGSIVFFFVQRYMFEGYVEGGLAEADILGEVGRASGIFFDFMNGISIFVSTGPLILIKDKKYGCVDYSYIIFFIYMIVMTLRRVWEISFSISDTPVFAFIVFGGTVLFIHVPVSIAAYILWAAIRNWGKEID